MKTKPPVPTPPAPPPPMSPSAAASQFIGIYVAIVNYARLGPPEPYRQAMVQAIASLAPLAADVMIQDKLASQAAAAPEAAKPVK